MSTESLPATIDRFLITPTPGTPPALFADHQAKGRSGHLGHTMFQTRDGEVCAFFSNCTGSDHRGHSAMGWMEYRKSSDCGATWSEARPWPLSKEFSDRPGDLRLFTEKAVTTDKGAVVLFALVSDVSKTPTWEPYRAPFALRSADGGKSWSDQVAVGEEPGRIFSAIHRDGVTYVLKFRNDSTIDYVGTLDEHVYQLFSSTDDGKSFQCISTVPFDTTQRCYGTLAFLPDGSLIAYIYNRDDEFNLDYCISDDGGVTWSSPKRTFMAQRMRNPQMIAFGGGYFMHGRSGSEVATNKDELGHVILYYSTDGISWDGGTVIGQRLHGHGAYSNSLVVKTPGGGQRLRIQSSLAYDQDKTNVVSWWVDPR